MFRHAIRVRGTVQGVGFRPTVHRIARARSLGGFVRNDPEGVLIEIEGAPDVLAEFPSVLRRELPPLARIDAIEVREIEARGEIEFRVAESGANGSTSAAIPADSATCEACIRELFDPRDRRHRYPFVNCTDCGPRYTIVRDLPYDRTNTTMDAFAMCAACRAEYEDPSNRRFHAEPIACAACGPRLVLGVRRDRRIAESDEALSLACGLLACGAIVAVKGLGGYQLAVDAADGGAVQRLRDLKRRPHKPFALMARDLATVERLVFVDDEARRALGSPAHPIVILPMRPEAASRVAPAVAPGLSELGVMLPTTPLHHLLFADGLDVVVMTSGNVAEEPIAKDDDEALDGLRDIADAFLLHDRPIHTRADDSVVRAIAGGLVPIRRARGLAPDPLPLGFDAPPVLAVGAEMKNAVCLTRGSDAFLSQHVGDLGSLEARAFFGEVISKMQRLLGVAPAVVAHDLHPDYAATRWARASGLPAIAVQHHHAHVAACLAEHQVHDLVIGVAFDGTGCGPAGDAWGGEILVCDLAASTRAGHLRPIALPGGEAAIREPWRLAVAALVDAGEPIDRVADPRRESVRAMIEKRLACPLATGAGRWFDAVSAILGVRDVVSYEAQAAVELEAIADRDDAEPYPFDRSGDDPFEIDLRPTIRAIAADVRAGVASSRIAARFHATMAEAVRAACVAVRAAGGPSTVALSGGCFQNALFSERTKARLESDGFRVLVHRAVPPNDGGIALGQAAVAAWRLRTERRS